LVRRPLQTAVNAKVAMDLVYALPGMCGGFGCGLVE
jgi:hypothetical protein